MKIVFGLHILIVVALWLHMFEILLPLNVEKLKVHNMKTVQSDFCIDDFWDSNLTWNTQTPRFTECFKNTAILFPSIVFVVTSVPWIIWIVTVPPKLILKSKPPVSWIYVWKMCLTCFLVVVSVLQIYLEVDKSIVLTWSSIFNFSLKLMTLLSTLALNMFERRKRVISSLVLSIFWPCYLFASIPDFVNSFQEIDQLDQWEILSLLACFITTFALIFVNALSDISGFELEADVPPKHLASYLSGLIFAWFDPIVSNGYKNPLNQKDLPAAADSVDVKENVDNFIKHWKNYVMKHQVNFSDKNSERKRLKIWKPLLKSFGTKFLVATLFFVVNNISLYISPMILKLFINHVDPKYNEESWKGYLYAFLLLCAGIFSTLTFTHGMIHTMETSIRVRTALISAICRKSLKLASSARQKYTSGEITNLVSVDTQRINDGLEYVGNLWGAPLQVVIGMWLVYREVGTAALIGSIGLLILVPLNLIGGKFVEKLETKQLAAKDSRLKLMSEILNGIKVLKLYAWELPFMKKINEIRGREIKFLKVNAWLWGILNFTFCMSPFLVTIGSFRYVVNASDIP